MNSLIKKTGLNEYSEYYSILKDIFSNDTVRKMKKYRQHYDTSTFEHCFNVSYISYKICKKLNLDYKSAARAGMVHDLFLYDWRSSTQTQHLDRLHAFAHPKIALDNASKLFDLNDKEKDIISKHMWPLTLAFPKYPESFVVTFADKYSAIAESCFYYKSFLSKKNITKYAYIFLCLLIFV